MFERVDGPGLLPLVVVRSESPERLHLVCRGSDVSEDVRLAIKGGDGEKIEEREFVAWCSEKVVQGGKGAGRRRRVVLSATGLVRAREVAAGRVEPCFADERSLRFRFSRRGLLESVRRRLAKRESNDVGTSDARLPRRRSIDVARSCTLARKEDLGSRGGRTIEDECGAGCDDSETVDFGGATTVGASGGRDEGTSRACHSG